MPQLGSTPSPPRTIASAPNLNDTPPAMRPALLLILAVTPAFAVETTYPAAFEQSRYETMMKDSPFALATAAAEAPTPKDKFSANWKVTVLGKIPDAEGQSREWVIVRSQDQRV